MTKDSKDTKPSTIVENQKTQLTEEELKKVSGGTLSRECAGGKHFETPYRIACLYVLPLASEMEEPMRKTKKEKRPKSTDTLLRTSKKKDIVLTEKELGKVSGGMKVENPNVKTGWKY